MSKFSLSAAVFAAGVCVVATLASAAFRPPAVPLVTSDPYLSIWSDATHLTDKPTVHWTGRAQPLVSLIRVDGKSMRLMGNDPRKLPAMHQTSVRVLPTRSIYEFEGSGVQVTLTFMTPVLPSDLDVMARPVTYLTWSVRSTDGQSHTVQIYDSTSSKLSVSDPSEKVTWSHQTAGNLTALRAGTEEQPVLTNPGDATRINWGYAYTAARTDQSSYATGDNAKLLQAFINNGKLANTDDTKQPRAAGNHEPVLAFAFDLGSVSSQPVNRQVLIAYDEIWSINFFGEKLRPYWRRNGATPATLLQDAEHDYAKLEPKCEAFDNELMADATKVGDAHYADMVALAYRQCWAGCGLAADSNGKPLFFTKENTSNGDIATVDVIFPMDPAWVLLSPTLAKASLVPDFVYAATKLWKFPNAPHDLGSYPIAMGHPDGGEGMPVEESGNMLILSDAIAHDDGNADFVKPWWPQLTQWATYLQQYGLDPENQLCTDDFMGHLAHNANLSVKAILGLAAYGDLCKMRGDTATADKYTKLAKTDAAHWVKVAEEGDHSLLAFDKPGTWSQKYNLVWDKLLGLNVFPPQVSRNEIAFYKTKLQRYGLPLDSRTKITKSDWTTWCATMADSKSDFDTLINPMYDYLNTTTTRVPFADEYNTTDIHSNGMHARPVIGGVLIRLLSDKAIWHKWSSRDTMHVSGWAPLPPPPVVKMVIPTGRKQPVMWKYTTTKPKGNWTSPDFDDSSWKTGPAPFGSDGTPNIHPRTIWNTDDIWARRSITIPDANLKNLQLYGFHDEDVQAYLDGTLAASEAGYISQYQPLDLRDIARKQLVAGAKVLLAIHVHQTQGGQGMDYGMAIVTQQTR